MTYKIQLIFGLHTFRSSWSAICNFYCLVYHSLAGKKVKREKKCKISTVTITRALNMWIFFQKALLKRKECMELPPHSIKVGVVVLASCLSPVQATGNICVGRKSIWHQVIFIVVNWECRVIGRWMKEFFKVDRSWWFSRLKYTQRFVSNFLDIIVTVWTWKFECKGWGPKLVSLVAAPESDSICGAQLWATARLDV